MARRRRTLNPTLLIVCEGTETERPYFEEIAGYVECQPDRIWEKVKVVPETSHETVKHDGSRPVRQVKKEWRYNLAVEATEEDYKRFCPQPLRYVREAYLLSRDGAYAEAWAVYDLEKHTHHEQAWDSARQWGIRIAFSSYCFEQWLLLHFERNAKPFTKGECHEGKGAKCGEGCESDCKGEICLSGRLRAAGYIPGYRKNRKKLFEGVTLPCLEEALLNAAWTRRTRPEKPWLCNPYTNVDELVKRLLDEPRTYEWIEPGDPVAFGGTTITLKIEGDKIIVKNEGERSVILFNDWECLGEDLGVTDRIKANSLLRPGEATELPSHPEGTVYLRLREDPHTLLLTLPK